MAWEPEVESTRHYESNDLGSNADSSHALVHPTNAVFIEHHRNYLLAEETAVNKIDAAPPPPPSGELQV